MCMKKACFSSYHRIVRQKNSLGPQSLEAKLYPFVTQKDTSGCATTKCLFADRNQNLSPQDSHLTLTTKSISNKILKEGGKEDCRQYRWRFSVFRRTVSSLKPYAPQGESFLKISAHQDSPFRRSQGTIKQTH